MKRLDVQLLHRGCVMSELVESYGFIMVKNTLLFLKELSVVDNTITGVKTNKLLEQRIKQLLKLKPIDEFPEYWV